MSVEVYESLVRVKNPYLKGYDNELKWFWYDESCAEPIGPFATEDEARKDYAEVLNER